MKIHGMMIGSLCMKEGKKIFINNYWLDYHTLHQVTIRPLFLLSSVLLITELLNMWIHINFVPGFTGYCHKFSVFYHQFFTLHILAILSMNSKSCMYWNIGMRMWLNGNYSLSHATTNLLILVRNQTQINPECTCDFFLIGLVSTTSP